jgi:hypothetical protein
MLLLLTKHSEIPLIWNPILHKSRNTDISAVAENSLKSGIPLSRPLSVSLHQLFVVWPDPLSPTPSAALAKTAKTTENTEWAHRCYWPSSWRTCPIKVLLSLVMQLQYWINNKNIVCKNSDQYRYHLTTRNIFGNLTPGWPCGSHSKETLSWQSLEVSV